VTQLISQMGPTCPGRCQVFGSLPVVSTFNYADHPSAPLSENNRFQDAMAPQISDPVAALYGDVTALLQTVDVLVYQLAPQGQQIWREIRDSLGLDGFQTVMKELSSPSQFRSVSYVDLPQTMP